MDAFTNPNFIHAWSKYIYSGQFSKINATQSPFLKPISYNDPAIASILSNAS